MQMKHTRLVRAGKFLKLFKKDTQYATPIFRIDQKRKNLQFVIVFKLEDDDFYVLNRSEKGYSKELKRIKVFTTSMLYNAMMSIPIKARETMEDKSQEKPQRNRGHRDNKNEYRERRDKRDNRERRPYRADTEAAEASANETNEVNAANAGRENKDGYKKPYKGGKNRPNKQKYNRNKDYKNKNYNKEYNKDYNRDKDNGSTDTQ